MHDNGSEQQARQDLADVRAYDSSAEGWWASAFGGAIRQYNVRVHIAGKRTMFHGGNARETWAKAADAVRKEPSNG